MRLITRVAVITASWLMLAPVAWAQNPPPNPANPQTKARQNPPPRVQQGTPAKNAPQTQNRAVYKPTQYQRPSPSQPGTVLRHYPYSASSEYSYGFRNPGGVGRFEEYYPPGNSFQNGGRDPVSVAGFDKNIPVGSIDEQAMAYNAGTARYSAIQQHMDNFARPMGGFGWGYGLGAF
jgi:hypothetical protein